MTSSNFQLSPASPEIFRPTIHFPDVYSGDVRPITTVNPHPKNPRKKRTNMIQIDHVNMNMNAVINGRETSGSSHSRKPKYVKKPDPTAPKITRPCSECGKRFWSWKALFGHMRCHPERPWRGINPPPAPPPNLHHTPPLMSEDENDAVPISTTNEDHYIASCLLMLSKASPTSFECTSCKKVFGSHQALGGHRASHKNVKGCFAITRSEGGEEFEGGEMEGHFENNNSSEHKCSICLRVFSSGQALGGHKRCHWENEDDVVPHASKSVLSSTRFDLNLPASLEDYSSSSNLGLDLRLGL